MLRNGQRRRGEGVVAAKLRHSHLPVVVSTRRLRDLFAKRWWVRCWQCKPLGPFPDRGFAEFVKADHSGGED